MTSQRNGETAATWAEIWLVLVGIAYPFVSAFLMRGTSTLSNIPTPAHWVVLCVLLPAVVVIATVAAKLTGARLKWNLVFWFSVWIAAVGYGHHCLISWAWDSI